MEQQCGISTKVAKHVENLEKPPREYKEMLENGREYEKMLENVRKC